MTTTAGATHLPPLGRHVYEEVGNELQATLVELLDLSLVGKQLHWCLVGELFRPLHLYLDELVGSWHELSDTVAERAVAVGSWPDGQASAVAAASLRRPLPRGAVEDHVAVLELVTRLAQVSERTRARMDRLGELDAASQDVLVQLVRTLEKQLWMLRVQLRHRGDRP